MRQTRIVTVLFILPLLILLSACGDSRLHKAAQEAFEKGDYEGAKTSATTLIQEYPTSEYASLAKEILQKIEEGHRKLIEVRLEQLTEALNNKDTRRDAIKQLGELRDERVVEPLIEALKYEKTKEDVIEALGKVDDERAVNTLIAIIKNKNEDFDNREAAVVALAEINNNYIPPLIESFATPLDDRWTVPLIFQKAAGSKVQDVIERIGEPAVEPLIEILKKSQKGEWAPYVRQEVTKILGRFGDKRAVEPLIAALRRGNEDRKILWRERQYIAKALGSIGDDRAVEPLIEALTSAKKISWTSIEEDMAMDDIVKALEKITNQDFGSDPKKWKEWWKENKR